MVNDTNTKILPLTLRFWGPLGTRWSRTHGDLVLITEAKRFLLTSYVTHAQVIKGEVWTLCLLQRTEVLQQRYRWDFAQHFTSSLLIMMKTNFPQHWKVGSEGDSWCLPFCDFTVSWQSRSHTPLIKSQATKIPDLLHILKTWTWNMF